MFGWSKLVKAAASVSISSVRAPRLANLTATGTSCNRSTPSHTSVRSHLVMTFTMSMRSDHSSSDVGTAPYGAVSSSSPSSGLAAPASYSNGRTNQRVGRSIRDHKQNPVPEDPDWGWRMGTHDCSVSLWLRTA